MKIKKTQINVLLNTFNVLLKGNYPVSVEYFATKNIKILQNELDLVKELEEKYLKDYTSERIKLNEQYAEKDENNKPIIENNLFKIADTKAFSKEFEQLNIKYKKDLDEFNKFMNEETEINIFTIKLDKIENLKFPENVTLIINDYIES